MPRNNRGFRRYDSNYGYGGIGFGIGGPFLGGLVGSFLGNALFPPYYSYGNQPYYYYPAYPPYGGYPPYPPYPPYYGY